MNLDTQNSVALVTKKKYSQLNLEERVKLLESILANLLLDSGHAEEEVRLFFADNDKSLDIDYAVTYDRECMEQAYAALQSKNVELDPAYDKILSGKFNDD